MNANIKYELNNFFPQLIEDFISLEGEGIGVGIASLFLRVNKCNNTCTFCDTAFSIPGHQSVIIQDKDKLIDSSKNLLEYLMNKYSAHDREFINNLTITGGEPLLNLDYFKEFIDTVIKVFPNINRIIIETNGSILNDKQNCFKLIESTGSLDPNIELILSLSPKLNSRISHSGRISDDEVLDMYILVMENYRSILDKHFDIQLKFVHNDILEIENSKLINYIINSLKYPIPRNKILIMPFTPKDPNNKHKDIWSKNKDDASIYALKNKFRYSPRIHLDRNLK